MILNKTLLFLAAQTAALEPTLVNITTTSASESDSVNKSTTVTTKAPINALDTTFATPNETQLDVDEPMARQAVEEGRAVTPIGTKELDGRSAYINNQYVSDEAQLPYNNTSPPLYQFLQEQVEQILASSLPSEYRLENNAAIKESVSSSVAGKEMVVNGYGMPALQNTVSNPIFGYGGNNFQEEHDDMVGAYGKGPDDKYSHGTAATNPSTLELPKPMKMQSIGTRPKLTHTATATTTTTTTTTEAPSAPNLGGYGGGQVSVSAVAAAQRYKPQVSNNNNNGYDLQHMPSYKPQLKEEYYSPNPNPNPSKYTYVRQNSTVHMRKRRITFKTVGSASQIISTPLADLMFKYSIGVAKPSMAAGGNSLYEQDDPPIRNAISSGYNDNLDLPKHTYVSKISHSSHRKI